MSIKVIVMDVDGTLSNSNKEISQLTRDTLLKAQDQGALLILASGRPTSGLIEFGETLGMREHDGLFVSYNGSKVVNVETMEELFNEPMSIEEGRAVLEHLKQFEVMPMIDKGEYMYVNNVFGGPIQFNGGDFNVIEYESRGGNFKLCEIDDLAAFADFPINKILTTGETPYLQENYQAMMEPFKDSLNCVFTGPFYFEYTANGIDKAKALDTVLSPMGYTRDEIISFGDGHNDLSIIEYAGIGVAMGNAVDEVKAAADYVTTSNDEDGIAHALFKYMPELNE